MPWENKEPSPNAGREEPTPVVIGCVHQLCRRPPLSASQMRRSPRLSPSLKAFKRAEDPGPEERRQLYLLSQASTWRSDFHGVVGS